VGDQREAAFVDCVNLIPCCVPIKVKDT